MANPVNDALALLMVAFAAVGLLAVAASARETEMMPLREGLLAAVAAAFALAMGASALL